MTYILAKSNSDTWEWLSYEKELFAEFKKSYRVSYVKSPYSLFGNHYEIAFNSLEEFNKFCEENSPVTLESCAGELIIYI